MATKPLGGLLEGLEHTKASISGMTLHIIPLMVMNIIMLFMTTYIAWLSKALPKLLFGMG